jgi:hypothetical protein
MNTKIKEITKKRLNKAIIAVINSPNKSAERAGLWAKLQKLRSENNH